MPFDDTKADDLTTGMKIFRDSGIVVDQALIDEMNKSAFLREELWELNQNTDMVFEFDVPGKQGADTVASAPLGSQVNGHSDYMEISTTTFPVGINLIAIMAHEGIHALEEKDWSNTHTGDTFASTYISPGLFTSTQTDINTASNYVDFEARSEALATIGQTIVADEIKPSVAHSDVYRPSWAAQDTEKNLMVSITPIEDTIDPENIRSDPRLNSVANGGLSYAVDAITLSYTDYVAYKFGLEETGSNLKYSYRASWATSIYPEAQTPPAAGKSLLPKINSLVGNHYEVPSLGGRKYNISILSDANEKAVAAVITDLAVGVPNSKINGGRLVLAGVDSKQPGGIPIVNATSALGIPASDVAQIMISGVQSPVGSAMPEGTQVAQPAITDDTSAQVWSDPSSVYFAVGDDADGTWFVDQAVASGDIAYHDVQVLDDQGNLVSDYEAVSNLDGSASTWETLSSDITQVTLEADNSVTLTDKAGTQFTYGKDGVEKLELSGMSADQIGVILQEQQDDIDDPKLGSISEVTLPDGTALYKTGTDITEANPSWALINSGQSFSQNASNLITGDDIPWMVTDSSGNAESVPIISLVGLSMNSSGPIYVYPTIDVYPKALIVAGNQDVYFYAEGKDTLIGGSGHLSARTDFTDGNGNISLEYWGGTGDADFEATGPENLHLGTGSNHIYFGGALFPAFQPSMLHVSGFDPSKDSITPSGANLDQLATLVATGNNWLQFADNGSGQQHSPWEAFGYSNFQQDPATGKMTVTAGAGSDYVKGGAEDLVVSEAGGNDTILAGAGHATVTTGAGMSSVDLSAGAYASTVTSNGQDTITSGSGADTVTLLAGMASVVGGSGRDRITDQSSGNMIQGGAGGLVLLAAANTGGDVISTARGATDTLTLGTGADSVFSGGTDTINVGAAIANITAFGSFTITQSTGTTQVMKSGGTAASATVVGGLATITGGADGNGLSINTSATGVGTQITLGLGADSITTFGPTTIQGGSGLMVFTGHANAIVTDGSGGEQVQMGGGNTQFTTTAGTHNTLNLGSGSQNVISGGNDSIYAGAGAVTVSAPTGAVLLYASTGPLTFLGGSGTSTVHGKASGGGAMSVLGGAGAMTVTGSSGNDTLVAGAGNVTFTEGNGSVSAQLGSGNATVTGGSGSDILNLVFGTSTGNGVINGFKVATDHIHLSGYGASEAQNALASKTVSGGNTTMVFSGGEHLILNGVTGLTASSFS